jgi:hypothetical protein
LDELLELLSEDWITHIASVGGSSYTLTVSGTLRCEGLDGRNNRRRAVSVEVAVSQSQPCITPCLRNSRALLNGEELLLPCNLGEPLQESVANGPRQLDHIADPHRYLSLNLSGELLDPLQVAEDRSLVEQ